MEIIEPTELYCMTKGEAAKRYRLSFRKLHDLVREGVIPSVRLGHRTLRIPVKKVDAAMDKLAELARGGDA